MIVTSTLRMQLDAAGFVKSAAQLAEAVDRDVKHLHDLKTALRDTGASEKLQASMVKLGASTQHIEGMRRAMAEFRKEQGTTGKAWGDLTKDQRAALRTFESATAATMRAVIIQERDLTTALKREADQRHDALLSKEQRMRDAILADAQKSEDRRIAMMAAAEVSHVAIAKREAAAKALIEREVTANLKTEIKAREGASEAELATMRRIAGLERDARVKAIQAETAAIVASRDKQHAVRGGHGDGKHFDSGTVGGLIGFTVAHEFEEGARKAIEQYREFDKERRYGGAVMGLGFDQQRELVMQAIRGGGTSKFNDIQWLESQREFAARGYSKDQVLGFTPTAARLATALDKTMPEAVKLMEGSLLGFGKDTSTYFKAMAAAERTADLQVKASKISGMQAEDIEALYKRGAAPARMAGLSEENLLAFGAISKKANLGGDEASTAFRALVKDLVSPTVEARTAMSAAGLDFSKYQAAPKSMNLNGFVQEVARKYGVQLDHNTIMRLGSLFNNRSAVADPSAFTPAVTQLLRSSLGGNDAKSLKSIAGLAGRYRDDSVGKVDVDRLMNDVIVKMAENPALANSIFGGKNGGKIFAALGDPAFFKKILGELLNESQGYAAKVSDARMAGFDGALSKLSGSMLNLEGAFGRAFDNDGRGGLLTSVTAGAAGLAQALAEADPAVLRMSAAAAAGVTAFAGLKAAGWLNGGFGLNTAATALEGSAVALDAAAARLGVAGAASTTGGAAVAGGGAAAAATGVTAAGLLARALPPVALTYMAIEAGNYEKNRAEETARTWNTLEAQALPDLGEQTILQRLWGTVPKGKPIVATPERASPVPEATPVEPDDDDKESWDDAPGHADGGIITGPGGPRSDRVRIRVSPGEAVIPADVVRANLPLIQGLISRRSLVEGGVLRSDSSSRAAALGASIAPGGVTRVALATDSSSAAALRQVVGEGMYDALRRIRNEGEASGGTGGLGSGTVGTPMEGGGTVRAGRGPNIRYGRQHVPGGSNGLGRFDGDAPGANGYGLTNAPYTAPLDAKGEGGHLSPQELFSYLKSHGATDNEATMLTGAAGSESSFNPNAIHDVNGKNGPGHGLWGHNDHRINMTGLSWQQQADRALAEVKREYADRVNAAKTPEELADAEMHYERPRGYHSNNPRGGDNYTGRLNTLRRFSHGFGTMGFDQAKPEAAPSGSEATGTVPAGPDGIRGHVRGTLKIGDESFAYGSGGVRGSAHIPYGDYPINPDAPGAWGRAHNAMAVNNDGSIWDQSLGRMRTGIEMHVAHSANMVTEGCMSFLKDQYPTLKQRVRDMVAKTGHAYLHVGPGGASITPEAQREAERAVLPHRPSAGASAAPERHAAGVDFDHSSLREGIDHLRTFKAELAGLKGGVRVAIDHNHKHEDEPGSRPGKLRTALNGHYGSDGRSWT